VIPIREIPAEEIESLRRCASVVFCFFAGPQAEPGPWQKNKIPTPTKPGWDLISFAERGGFEPPVPVTQYDSLANCWFQPLTHLSRMIVERMINRIKRAPLFRVRQKYKIKSQSQNYGFKI
jgi:hypothetical protein